MIDTIKLHFIIPPLDERWISQLSNEQEHDLIGQRTFKGWFGAYYCRIAKNPIDKDFQVTLEGSMVKSVLGHNIGTLTHSEICQELERIAWTFEPLCITSICGGWISRPTWRWITPSATT